MCVLRERFRGLRYGVNGLDRESKYLLRNGNGDVDSSVTQDLRTVPNNKTTRVKSQRSLDHAG